jgi:hypothetical protein
MGSAITAIATILLTVITGGLVVTAYEQSKTSRAQLRAYIMVTEPELIRQNADIGEHGLKFEGRPGLQNVGSTPANKVFVISRMDIMSMEKANDFSFYIERPPISQVLPTIWPTQKKFVSAIMDRICSDKEIESISVAHRALMFVWGTVWYEDVFREKHYTNFCYTGLLTPPDLPIIWRTVDRHSDAT